MPRAAPLSIAVIGAGLGGLTAAVALRRAGFDVQVYEQAAELTEVGGGINMGPNASRVLYRLGLGEALDREAVRPLSTRRQDSLPSPGRPGAGGARRGVGTGRRPLARGVALAFRVRRDGAAERLIGGRLDGADQPLGIQGQYFAIAPPSTRRSKPVTISASSEARNTAARA